MAKDNTDWDSEEAEGLIEQYIKLMPYILRDFVHKDDIKAMIAAILLDPSGRLVELASTSEGSRAALAYKSILDSGEEMADKVPPVVKI